MLRGPVAAELFEVAATHGVPYGRIKCVCPDERHGGKCFKYRQLAPKHMERYGRNEVYAYLGAWVAAGRGLRSSIGLKRRGSLEFNR